jgi:hypothetical protein
MDNLFQVYPSRIVYLRGTAEILPKIQWNSTESHHPFPSILLDGDSEVLYSFSQNDRYKIRTRYTIDMAGC